jgi:hypothetical protein
MTAQTAVTATPEEASPGFPDRRSNASEPSARKARLRDDRQMARPAASLAKYKFGDFVGTPQDGVGERLMCRFVWYRVRFHGPSSQAAVDCPGAIARGVPRGGRWECVPLTRLEAGHGARSSINEWLCNL